jgi:hypothetical protein
MAKAKRKALITPIETVRPIPLKTGVEHSASSPKVSSVEIAQFKTAPIVSSDVASGSLSDLATNKA